MEHQEVLKNLCDYDSRNPDNLNEFNELSEEDIKKAMKDCNCDNCFYGRDRLANEILRITDKP